MYIYTSMYIYMYIYIHICIYVCISLSLSLSLSVYIYIYLFIYIYITYITINRIACGRVRHVALVRCNSFDEGVWDCFAGALRTWVTKVRIFILKRFKMYQKGYPTLPTWSQKGANRKPKRFIKPIGEQCLLKVSFWTWIGPGLDLLWEQLLIKIRKKKTTKIFTPKPWFWCQRGAKMEPKSMLKLINDQWQNW